MILQSFSPTDFDPFAEMQKAVDVVSDSAHPTNKIAATIYGHDRHGKRFSLSRTNFWPPALLDAFGENARIGDSSTTIHAETNCILSAPYAQGSAMFITDPFCPNCAKNMAEAGISHIFIDHKGLDKDWISRNKDAFRQMSLRICERAGINVYKIKRKERHISAILQVEPDYVPLLENPVEIDDLAGAEADFGALLAATIPAHKGHEFACALAVDDDGHLKFMTARRHAAIGYSRKYPASMEEAEGKYSFIVQPINRLLMNAARHGLTLQNGAIFTSRVPTSREQVNMAGAGITHFMIGDGHKCRDPHGFSALTQMKNARIFHILSE